MFELQPDERRLLKDEVAVALRPRAFDLLVALVEQGGHLVTKDDLLDRVRPKVVVEEAALHVQISALRKILGADAIATVSGQGYRFALPVTKDETGAHRAPPTHNLRYQLTTFVGREREIAQLEELLATNRLVTLTGAGGCRHSGSRSSWASQRWTLSAATSRQSNCCWSSTMQSIVLDGSVPLIDQVLRHSPRVTALVTSRERLGVAGEFVYRVPSLSVPELGREATPEILLTYDGVRLFVDRARLLRPHFKVTADNAAAVASICSRLDGIPLAVEPAAPRLRSMSVEELNQRLDQRFALLTDGSRTALPRHRTLRSMIDWSYDLLTEVEQAILRRLAVFAGGWTLASAETVCSGDGIETAEVMVLLALAGGQEPDHRGRAGRRHSPSHTGNRAGVRPRTATRKRRRIEMSRPALRGLFRASRRIVRQTAGT